MQIRTHQYAEDAFPLVKSMIGTNAETKKLEAKYRTLALNFPTMIMQSGLAQAIGFLLAKSKDNLEHKIILDHIEKILKGVLVKSDLHNAVLKSNIQEYQLLTRQALDATAWLKRYTQALLSKEGDNQ